MAALDGSGDNKKKEEPKHEPNFDIVNGAPERRNGPTGSGQPVDAKGTEAPTGAVKKDGDVTAPAKPAGQAGADAKAPDKAPDKAPEKAPDKAPEKGLDRGLQHAPEKVNPVDQLKKVNDILDKEVPALNKAGKLDEAKAAYEKAIREAEKVSKQDIEKAKLDLAEVQKKLKTETNVEEKTRLKEKERELFSVSRIKDAAYGNMALWYYRQGKAEDGNTKLLQAAGIDEATAKKHAKLAPEDLQKLGETGLQLQNVTIFDDIHFQRQMKRIEDSNGAPPDAYFVLHDKVRAFNDEAAKKAIAQAQGDKPAGPVDKPAGTGDKPAGTGDKPAGPVDKPAEGGDKPQTAAKPYDAKSVEDRVVAGANYLDALGKATDGRKIDDNGKKLMDDSINALVEMKNHFQPAAVTAATELIKQVGEDKFETVLAANKVYRQEAVKVQSDPALLAIMQKGQSEKPEEREAAQKELTEKFPAYAKAQQDYIASVGGDPKKAYDVNLLASPIHSYRQAADMELMMRTQYGNALVAADDKTGAANQVKAITESLGPQKAEALGALLKDPELGPQLKKLYEATGGDASAVGTAGDGVPALVIDKSKPLAEQMKDKPVDQLENFIRAEQGKGNLTKPEVKAAYEELIRQFGSPEYQKANREIVEGNQKMLTEGKNAEGKDLTPEERYKLHAENYISFVNMQYGANLQLQYAKYLGDFGRREKMAEMAKAKEPYEPGSVQRSATAFVEGGVNELGDMQKWSQSALKAADALPYDLMKKEMQLQGQSIGKVGPFEEQLAGLKLSMNGDIKRNEKGEPEISYGMKDLSVTYRLELAQIYLRHDMMNQLDLQLSKSPATQVKTPDELYKPQVAGQMASEALAMWQKENPTVPHTMLNQLVAFGEMHNPQAFKDAARLVRADSSSGTADMASMATAFVLNTGGKILLAKYAKLKGPAADLGGDAIGLAGAIGVRSAVMYGMTGEAENFRDTLVHGTASAAMVSGFKYGSRLFGTSYRTENMSYRAVAGGLVDANSSGVRFAEEMLASGKISGQGADLAKELVAIEQAKAKALPISPSESALRAQAIMGKPIKDMTEAEAQEMYRMLGLKDMNKAQLTEFMGSVLKTRPADKTVLARLAAADLIDLKTVGDLEVRAQAHSQRMVDFAGDVDKALVAGNKRLGDNVPFVGLRPETKIDSIVRRIAKENPGKYADEQAIKDQITFLKNSGVSTLGDLKAYYFEAKHADMGAFMENAAREGLLPERGRMTRAKEAVMLSDSQSVSNVLAELKKKPGVDPDLIKRLDESLPVLERMGIKNMRQLQEAHAMGGELQSVLSITRRHPDLADAETASISDLLRRDPRALGLNGNLTSQRIDGILGTRTREPGIISRTATGAADFLYRDRFYNFTSPSRNWGKIDPNNTNLAQLERTSNQIRTRAALGGSLIASSLYRGTTGVYDNAIDTDALGRPRIDQELGRQLTVGEALQRSLIGNGTLVERMTGNMASDVLLGSFLLRPAIAGSEQIGKGALGYVFYKGFDELNKGSATGYSDAADYDAKAKRMEAPLTNETNATGLVFEQVRQGQSAADQQVPQGQDTAGQIADAKQQEALRARQASEAKAKAEQEARERAAREQAAKDGKAPAPAQGQTSTNNDPLGLQAFDSP
ncbi:MAG: hypothetical protein K2Y32_06250 [Candidatus Obscuribacterales bacterium]|nr:hypothetical protein [Candidatus Obscuribacterales bacterium]